MPSEPLNVTANVTQPYNTTVNVSWSAPRYRNGIITKYHIYYQKVRENRVEYPRTVWNNMSETSHVVTNLTPYTNYSFWVRAETSGGVGDKSATTTIMTHEGGNLLWFFLLNLKNTFFRAVSSDKPLNLAQCLKVIVIDIYLMVKPPCQKRLLLFTFCMRWSRESAIQVQITLKCN